MPLQAPNSSSMMTREETDAHFTRRLESFSDIVFGLSLSIVALQLVPPSHPIDLFLHPLGLIGFGVSFGIVAMFWTYQHRLFLYFFFPDRINIGLMFVKLALIALIPFALQLYLKFLLDPVALGIYFGTFGLIMAINAITMLRGFLRFWNRFDEPFQNQYWIRLVRICVIAVLLFCAAIAAQFGQRWYIASIALIPISQLIVRRLVRRVPSSISKGFADA